MQIEEVHVTPGVFYYYRPNQTFKIITENELLEMTK